MTLDAPKISCQKCAKPRTLVKMPEFDVEGKNLACTLIGIEEDTENNEEEKKAEEESSLA